MSLVRWILGLMLLLPLVLPVGVSQAATVNALSCAPADIRSAIVSAAAGDTVQLPTCNQTAWPTNVLVDKKVIIQGNGVANTILHRQAVSIGFGVGMFNVNAGLDGVQFTAFTLDGTYDTNPNGFVDTGIHFNHATNFRVHHMNFTNLAMAVYINSTPTATHGVVDHNTFTDIWYFNTGTNEAEGYGVDVVGDGTYPTLDLGTSVNIFIEDNQFLRVRHAVASINGSRYVFRYNTATNEPQTDGWSVDAHGKTEFWDTGSRQYEIYNNIITNSVNVLHGVGIRGGDGVIFNNQFSSNISDDIGMYVETDGGAGGQSCSSAYPVLYQIRNLYIWGNTLIGGGTATIANNCSTKIGLNRDYFLIDKTTLGYVPYTYPHPLVGAPNVAPTVTITAPNSGSNTTVSTTPLTTLAGTVSDDVAVPAGGVTWSCPTCTPTSGTANCASCPSSPGATVTWSVSSIGLRLGGNPITVTATDAGALQSTDTILVTLDGPANYTSNLISYWPLDGSTTDLGTNGQPGTLVGTPAYDTAANCKVSTCLLLNGTSQWMTVAQAGKYVLHAMPFTIAAWVKDDTAAATLETLHHRVVVWHDATNGIGLGLGGVTTPSAHRFFYIQNRTTSGYEQASGPVSTGWHHVVATFDGLGTYNTYVDGVLSEATETTAPGIAPNDGVLYVGQNGAGGAGTMLTGNIDDLRIYDRELRAIDVTALYTAQTAGVPAPVVLRLVR